jgi:hypothetical protein
MNIIAQLNPYGAGTAYAESFHSLLQRTAFTHNVRMRRILRFVSAMRRTEVQCAPLGAGMAASLLGTGQVVRQMVDAFEELGGAPNVIKHTFYELSPVLSHRAIGLLATGQRWCPACIHPDSGIGYSPLAHSLKSVVNCRIHECRLESRCPSCSRAMSYTNCLFSEPRCRSCGAKLWINRRDPLQLGSYTEWVESQMYSLVAHVSNVNRPHIDSNWMDRAGQVLGQLVVDAKGRIGSSASKHVQRLRRSPRSGLRLSTVIWLAASHSTTVIDVLLRPNEVLTGVFPNLPEVHRHVPRRQAVKPEWWSKFRLIVRALLESKETCYLPGMATLSAITGANESYFWSQDRELYREYSRNRRLQKFGQKLACDRELVARIIASLPVGGTDHFSLEGVLARRSARLPAATLENIENTVGIALKVIGRRICIPPVELSGLFAHTHGSQSASSRIVISGSGAL